jgi:protein-disulfide isomerase
MLYKFSPRHPNAARAMTNWEKKSQYLLREIVKFRTYIDTLAAAQVQKQKIYAERAAAEEASKLDSDAASSSQAAQDDGASEAPKASIATAPIRITQPPVSLDLPLRAHV